MQNHKPGHIMRACLVSLSLCVSLLATASEATAQYLHAPPCGRLCVEKAHAACMNATNEQCFRQQVVSCQKACPHR